jgi:hypothetical protein
MIGDWMKMMYLRMTIAPVLIDLKKKIAKNIGRTGMDWLRE